MAVVCSVSVSTLNFGDVDVDSYEDLTFRITNTGDGTLAGSVSIATGGAQFSIQESDTSYSLTAGQYADFTVRFEPDAAGIFSGSVETGNALCTDISLSGVGRAVESTPYLQHDTGESTEVTIYFRHAAITPHRVQHELPASISRTEDKALKVYEHGLGGSKKRIWHILAMLTNHDVEDYRWSDLETFYWETAHGPREQLLFRDNYSATHTVRIIVFGPPQTEGPDVFKIRMILEEDYT